MGADRKSWGQDTPKIGGKMKLSDKSCKAAKAKETPYKLFDGGGLFLEVMPNGSKLWRLKYRFLGKEKRIVVQRPRELTRAQLRELKLELDRQGFSETSIKRAWLDTKNEEIAASIIGFIRKAAISDEVLIPYEDRVKRAIKSILSQGKWTDVQRQWLNRIGEQIEKTVVVDKTALDDAPFDEKGGFPRLNKIFDGKLETILGDINEEIWKKAG